MSKFQVPSSNGVGCGDDTDRQTNKHTNKYYAELQRKPLHIVKLVH